MKRQAYVILTFICMISVSLAFFKPQPPKYENLKVLPKNTKKYQMDSVMKHFSASLGVHCNFCHVKMDNEMKDWDFASDENHHKIEAREMMTMTIKINKKFFKSQGGQALTCYSCHNGKENPATFPPPKQE